VLCFLFQDTPDGHLLVERGQLIGYTWCEPLHRVLFEAIINLPVTSPESLQIRLLEVLTRKGYPDVDLKPFFHPHGLTRADAKVLIRDLRESSEDFKDLAST